MSEAPKKRPKNALRLGVFTSDIVLPGENEDDFVQRYQELRGAFNPSDPVEEEIVLDIAASLWIKRRLMRAEQEASRGSDGYISGPGQSLEVARESCLAGAQKLSSSRA